MGRKARDGPLLTFFWVDYEGTLQVEEASKFEFAVENGHGSAKSFGFGLLTLK